jgi:hypothetical protein
MIVRPGEERRLRGAATHRLVSSDISLLDKLCLSLLSQDSSLSAAWPSFSRRLKRASPDQGQPADNDVCRGLDESRIGIGERYAEQLTKAEVLTVLRTSLEKHQTHSNTKPCPKRPS